MPHVADFAISLDFLLRFARKVPDGYTTVDVVQKIIVPETKAKACRYVALAPAGEVGPAKYFISHRWAATFVSELVTLVAGHFADEADVANGAGPAVSSAGLSLPGNAEHSAQGKAASDTSAAASGGVPSDPTALPGGNQSTAPSRAPSADGSRRRSFVGPRTASLPGAQQSKSQLPPSQMSRQALTQPQQDDSGADVSSYPSNGGAASERWQTSQVAETRPAPGPTSLHCSSLGEPRSAISVGESSAAPAAAAVAANSSSATAADSRCAASMSACTGHGHMHGQVLPAFSRSSSRPWTVRETTGGISSGGGGLGSAVLGRPSLSCSAAAAREDDVTAAASYSHRTAAFAAAAALAATLLPGATTSAAALDEALDAVAAAAGDGSFSGSLNPLLARPSTVRHQWPQQQFHSMCSRYSACSVSSAGGLGGSGGSFSRHGPGVPLHPLQAGSWTTAAAATTPLLTDTCQDAAAAFRRDSGAGFESAGLGRCLPPRGPSAGSAVGPAFTAAASLTEPTDIAAAGGRSAAAIMASKSGRFVAPRVPPGREQRSGRCANSTSGYRHSGHPCGSEGGGGAGAVGAAVADRVSEASDTAAGDAISGIRRAPSSSSSRRSGTSSSKCSGGGCISIAAAAAAAPTNVELVDRLLARFAGREAVLKGAFVWLDIFAINQHPGTTQADDLAQLQEVVGRSEETLLVLDRAGLVLTRIWCLYEIWQTVRRKVPEALRVLAGPLEYSELARVWGELEVERAQATVLTDRDRILADIRATTGSEQLNRHIQQALVKSTCLDLEAARTSAPRTPHHGERAYRAAFLQRTAGSAASALAAAREAADVFCGCVGPADPRTLRALQAVAGCHKDLGAARQAVGLLEQQVIPFLEEAYGPENTDSQALDELGMLYGTLGQYDTAYDLLLAALCLRLRALQAAAPTAMAAPQLAAAMSTGPCAAALTAAAVAGRSGVPARTGSGAGDGDGSVVPPLEPLSGEHLTALLAAVRALVSELQAAQADGEARQAAAAAATLPPPPPPRQPSGRVAVELGQRDMPPLSGAVRANVELVGLSLHCLGMMQRERAQRRRSADSSVMLREARELMEASVGLLQLSSTEARGLTALDARANLAGLFMDGGDFQAAEQLLRDNLALTERVYGRDHPHTATAANNLALCLKRQRATSPDKALEAVALYRRCLEVCGVALGEAHPETLVVATNLGVLLADQRQWSESERLLTRAVAALPPQLGESHPDVLAAYRRLAEVLELRNKLFEAEAMFRITLQLAESAPAEGRDHGLVLECREGLQRVQDLLEAATRGQAAPGCCTIS